MSNLLKSRSGDVRLETWNYHANERWTYFPERQKQIIAFWLSQRVVGATHIELGSGWYETVPGSVAVDLSGISLEKHPAKEKYEFDFDDIIQGDRIPVENGRFESASMISVWQYLSHPAAFLQECERILCPGAELYIINKKRAGLSKLQKQPDFSPNIAAQIAGFGYDVIIEDIYIPHCRADTWQCVRVKMPGTRQGKLWEDIRNSVSGSIHDISEGYTYTSDYVGGKDIYDEEDQKIATFGELNPFYAGDSVIESKLFQEFLSLEMIRARYYFALLENYVPTKYSGQILEKVKQKARSISEKSGNKVLMWYKGLEVEFDFIDEKDIGSVEIAEITDRDTNRGESQLYVDKIGICNGYSIQHILASETSTIPLTQWNSSTMRSLFDFLSYFPLDDFTKGQQLELRRRLFENAKTYFQGKPNMLLQWEKKFNDELKKRRVLYFYDLYWANKQERKVQKFIQANQVSKKETPHPTIKHLKGLTHEEWILFENMLSSKREQPVYE